MNKSQRMEYEKNFRFHGLNSREERFYLEIINNCKEITNPNYKVGSGCRGTIVEITLKKENKDISFNGSVSYIDSNDIRENRYISGIIFKNRNRYYVDTKVERLGNVLGRKTYTTVDEFAVDGDTVVNLKNTYNYEMMENNNIGGIKK